MAQPAVGSPEWWLRRLHAQIVARRPALRTLTDYYDGIHPLAFASEKFLEAFGGLFRAFADNWCDLVVNAVEERLDVEGFRMGDDPAGDADAWAIWQRNELDAQSQLAHIDSLVCGETYATVWYAADGNPEITVEHPADAIVVSHPKLRRRRLAGLRLYRDEWGYEHAELFLAAAVHLWKSARPRPDELVDAARVRWATDDTVPDAADGTMPNPLGVVPMVALPNRPRLRPSRRGIIAQSEIVQVIPIQDAVNKLVADMLVTAEFAAYPQRVATGMEIPEDPVTHQPVNPFTPDKRVWMLEDPETKFHQFDAADLGNYVKAVELLIGHVASITRTPPHYLSPSADRLSGESIKAAETGLVAKCRRKMRHYGEAWEDAMRLAFAVLGDPRSKATAAETIWADPESRTEAEHVDAVLKKKSVDVPTQQLWEDLGYSPTQVERMNTMLAEQALNEALRSPLAEPATTPTEG